MSNAKDVLEFMTKVGPPLLDFAGDLFEMFDGDGDQAVVEIEDRRADIARRRARNDEALRAKHASKDEE